MRTAAAKAKAVVKQHLAEHGVKVSGVGLIGLAVYWFSVGQTDWAIAMLMRPMDFTST